MIKNLLHTLIVCMLFIYSCKQKEDKKTQPVESPVHVEIFKPVPGHIVNHSNQYGLNYSLYTPAGYNTGEKYSVIVFLDPHGTGNFPLKKYRSLADHFKVFLIGSNDSKNGLSMERGAEIAKALVEECRGLDFLDSQISLCGFSGGAKVALFAGQSIPDLTSIIYCGAALPANSIQITTPLIGIAGRRDMNYTEVKNFYSWAYTQIPECGVAEWKGKHEWPDTTVFRRALFWHKLNSKIENDDPAITEYANFIDHLVAVEENPLRKAEMLGNRAAILKKYVPVLDTKKSIGKILLSPEYNTAKRNEAAMMTGEDSRKNEFVNSFESRDLKWWSQQVAQLNADSGKEINQRLLGFISLAAYSYSSRAVTSNDYSFAQKALEIYELADPKNSEHEFLRACLYSKNNHPDSAIFFLKQAVTLGLEDRSKVENEKDLAQLHSRNDYKEIVNQLKY